MDLRLRPVFLYFLCCLLIATACSTISPKSVLIPPRRPARAEGPQRVHSDFADRAKAIRKIGILPPRVEAYQTVNGVREKMDEWIEIGRQGAIQELNRLINKRPNRFSMIAPGGADMTEYDDVMSLYSAIDSSIINHTRKNKDLFYERFRVFDYSVGSVAKLLDRHKVDAILVTLVRGIIIRQSLKPSMKGGIVTMAIIDRSGALLCFGDSDSMEAMDVRSADSVKQATWRAAQNLPEEAL